MASFIRRAGGYIAGFLASGADPGGVSGRSRLYAKADSGGVTRLYGQDSDGTVTQLTPGTTPRWNVTAVKTSAYNAVAGDWIRADPSGGVFTITLPTAVGISGQAISVKNTTNSPNRITIATTSSQTVDGSSTLPFIERGFVQIQFVSDGSNWMLA